MTYKSNYYNITTTTVEDSDKTLFFNFQRILSSELERFDFKLEDGRKIGLGYRINNREDSNKNVRFDAVDYNLKSFIITSHFDGNSDYGILIELESSQTKKMYIQIPLERDETGNVEDIRGELDVLIAKADEEYDEGQPDNVSEPEKNPTTLGELYINEWFLNVNTFNHYSENNVIYVYIESPTIKVRKFTMDLILTRPDGRFGNTPSLLNRITFPPDSTLQQSTLIKQFDIGDIGFEDIYIDCSPEDYDENNRIINPKKVYTVKPFFGSEKYGKISSNLGLSLLGVCAFGIVFMLFSSNLMNNAVNSSSDNDQNSHEILKPILKTLITIGLIIIPIFTIILIGKTTDGNIFEEKFIFDIPLFFILIILTAIVVVLGVAFISIYGIKNNETQNRTTNPSSNNKKQSGTFKNLWNNFQFFYNLDLTENSIKKYDIIKLYLIYLGKVFVSVTAFVMLFFALLISVGIKFNAVVYLFASLFFTITIYGIKVLKKQNNDKINQANASSSI